MLIGEVARRSGVSARMLRHYESLGLVRPSGRTGAGYREYSDADIRRIFHVESLRALGMSLREIGRALDDPDFAPATIVGDLVRATRERIAAETELLTRLRRIDAAGPADWEDVLQVVALLQALGSQSAGARQRAALAVADEVPVPVEALVEAVLRESEPNVAGALRWALARSGAGDGDGDGHGDGGPALLAEGLGSPVAAVRERAVRALAELPGEEADARLRAALGHPDAVVRGHAALALGARGEADAVPALVDLVVAGRDDTGAADVLGVLAGDTTAAERIATALAERLADAATDAPARGRLTQALAAVPGPTAARVLGELSRDADRAVALTATYVLRLRDAR
ncbi:MerR family transcriptional regulator [Streptomyces sp. AC536]|uniref:MerR family transcriptional regulator n=1 Tax=Streptomyces buecherae TaxID=2763006 RepID=UPI00164DF8B7|nr:MerR family transcriptional regulator [Streptomyces buecherae]MBC3982681.1 MerR family transcriptional regulator [Streptomyces buecherae]QNJ41618.1 MerR family transcriptional regulator [Streptomyces buecherae]